MIVIGIILLVVGAAVNYLAGGEMATFGRIVAVVGVALIVIGALLLALESGDGDHVGAAALLL